MGRYAVHCEGVSFSCKKVGLTRRNIVLRELVAYVSAKHGDADMGVSTASSASIVGRIRNIHGSAVANELLALEVSDKRLGFKATGMVSNANYNVKKTTLLLFINRMTLSGIILSQKTNMIRSIGGIHVDQEIN